MPTKKQKQLLDFIESFLAEHGYSPSYREIMSSLGYRSVSTVAEHINNLVNLGLLIKNPNSARTLEIVAPDNPHYQWFRTQMQSFITSYPDQTDDIAAFHRVSDLLDPKPPNSPK